MTFEDTAMNSLKQSPGGKNSAGWVVNLVVIVLLSLAALFALDSLFTPGKFQIKQVMIIGQMQKVDAGSVTRQVEASIHGNYFSANLDQIEDQLRQLPWVFDISLRRRWPETLIVEVVEILPVARWGKNQWINISGDIVAVQPSAEALQLPRLNGAKRDQNKLWKNFKTWQGKFAAVGLALESLDLDQRGNWIFTLQLNELAKSRLASDQHSDDLTVSVIVDDKNSQRKLERFLSSLATSELENFHKMAGVDLRYPNGFAVQWKAVADDPGNETEKLAKSSNN